MRRRIAEGLPIAAGLLRRQCEQRVVRTVTLVICVAAVGLAATGAAAQASGAAKGPPAGPKSPPFTQCPVIGADASCEYLIDVTSVNPALAPSVVRDPNQPFYDAEDDVLIGIQNDTSAPLHSIHIGVPGSGDKLFALDGDGMCWIGITPKPAECPFEAVTYAGPDTELKAESPDAGTVAFPTPLKPGQYTYFGLEAPPTRALVAGAVNDAITTTLTNTQTHETGAALAAPAPVAVIDRATIKGEHAAEATGEVEYVVYSDPSCTKVVQVLGTKKVVGGVAAASDPSSTKLPTNANYYWVAKYSGDINNSATTSDCGSETMSFGTPPAPPTVPGRPAPGHTGFTGAVSVTSIHLNEANGQITVTATLLGAGTLTANAVIKQGATIARACKRGYVSVRGRCVKNSPVAYGAAALNVSAAGVYKLVIKPTKRVLAALRRGRKPRVTVSVVFQPIPSGPRLTFAQTLTARIRKPTHHKH